MMSETAHKPETTGSLLIGGLMVIVFGLFAVMVAIGMGWVAAAVLGVVLLAMAWKVPVSDSARIVRFLIAAFGVISLIGAVVGLFS